MRHGKVQPLRVTTGLYGRPLEGSSGGMVSGLSWETISGSAAIATLLTEATAVAAAIEAPARKIWRRDVIINPEKSALHTLA